MAGGEGKRFWPMSSKKRPKQFLSLLGKKSLIRYTVDRLSSFIALSNIYIVTTNEYKEETSKLLPEIAKDNILAEPVGKNTGPCVFYGARVINNLDKDSVLIVLPADHAIEDEKEFIEVLNYAAEASCNKLQNGSYPLITLGVKPVRPDTGYGYIEKSNNLIDNNNKYSLFKVASFKEKPDIKIASQYLKSGIHLWNSGIFIWKTRAILSEFSKHLTEWTKYLDYDFRNFSKLKEFYDNIDPGAIDKLILEKSQNTLVIPVDMGWSDIGTWQSLDDYQRNEIKENIIRGNVFCEDTTGSLIFSFSDKPLVTIGVKDLVIVDCKDGILIIDKKKSQEVKNIIDKVLK